MGPQVASVSLELTHARQGSERSLPRSLYDVRLVPENLSSSCSRSVALHAPGECAPGFQPISSSRSASESGVFDGQKPPGSSGSTNPLELDVDVGGRGCRPPEEEEEDEVM